jgi:mRNA interferase YafQ
LPLDIRQTTRFRRDIKRLQKQGKNLTPLQTLINALVRKQTPESKFKDHKLVGSWAGHRECHIKPDWLMIYKVKENELQLIRTGSHADLFDM